VRPRTLLALLSAFLTNGVLSGCLVAPHDSFDTPQDTVLTFQSAFARGDEFKEYDCFAREMKEQQGLTQQVWSTARTTVFEPLGAMGRCVLKRNSLEDNLVGGALERERADLVYALLGHGMEVSLVPEAVLLLPNPVDRREDAWTLGKDRAYVDDHGLRAFVAPTFVAVVDVPKAVAAEYLARGLPWAELRNQWKILTVEAQADSKEAPAPLPPMPPSRLRTIDTGSIRVTRLRDSLGSVRLKLEFPLGGSEMEPDPNDCLPLQSWDRFRWQSPPTTTQ